MMLKKTLCVLSAGLLLSACMGGPSATQNVTKAGERKDGFMGLSKADAIKVNTPDAFKAANEVVIGNFMVGFMTNKKDSVKAGGGLMGNGFGGRSTAKSALNGIDDKTMQMITDQAYKDFAATLKANGYTILDRGPLLASEDFKKATPEASPYIHDQGTMLSAGNVTKYFAPSEFGGIYTFAGDIPGMMGGIGFSNPSMGAALFADKTKTKVLHVVYLVDFANSESYGGWHTSSSAVSVGQGLTIVPDATRYSIIGGQGGTFSTALGSITLGQPVSSDKEFASVEDGTSDGYKAAETAANVIGVLGGVGSNSTREYTFTAKPDAYKAASLDALSATTEAMTAKMAALR